MSMVPVDAMLTEFKPDDYTVRLVQGIFKVVPYAPALPAYRVIEDAVKAIKPDANAIHFAKARQMSAQKDILDVLWMANLMDTGDKGYAMLTGLKTAVNLARGQGAAALETDTQQRNDAVLKAIGISYMAFNAFPGSIAEKAEAFRTTPAAQALTMYYAAIEVALPFADNLATAGGNFLETLFSKEGAAQASKLAAMAPGKSIDGAMSMLQSITGSMQKVVDHAAKYAKPVAQSAQQYLPGAMSGADKVAGVVANAADVMPVYRYLGGRLAAEASALRAIKG
jgi:hypothetical protein